MPRIATVRVLVRNVEADGETLTFSNFSLPELDPSNYQAAREFSPGAMQREWLLERDYDAIPPLPPIAEGWPGPFGGIPFDVEDTLLLLRLYRPGDLVFAGIHVQMYQAPAQSVAQYPHRAISPLVTPSTRPFQFAQADCTAWERFAEPLKSAPQWYSSWFRVVRRCLLYAGGKKFNPNFHDDIDRVIDYMTALEATLVAKSKPHRSLHERTRCKATGIIRPGCGRREKPSERDVQHPIYPRSWKPCETGADDFSARPIPAGEM